MHTALDAMVWPAPKIPAAPLCRFAPPSRRRPAPRRPPFNACRPQAYTLQAAANLVCAIARIGGHLASSPQAHALLAALDVHVASLPPPHKAQVRVPRCMLSP